MDENEAITQRVRNVIPADTWVRFVDVYNQVAEYVSEDMARRGYRQLRVKDSSDVTPDDMDKRGQMRVVQVILRSLCRQGVLTRCGDDKRSVNSWFKRV